METIEINIDSDIIGRSIVGKLKVIWIPIFLFIYIASVTAQAVSVNPDEEFYKDAAAWEVAGYIDRLPKIRPYPVNLVEKIILEAMDAPNAHVRERALIYYDQIFDKPWTASASGGGVYKYYNKDYSHYSKEDEENGVGENSAKNYDKKYAYGDVRLAGSLNVTPIIGFSYDVGLYVRKNDELLPYYQNSSFDCVFDASEIGSLYMYLDSNMVASIGRENFYLQAGISRIGYGPFLNQGFALNDTSFHSASIVFNIVQPRWSYSQALCSLGATDMMGNIDNLTYGKFLAFHAIEYKLLPSLGVSYYETVVFGRRFEFSYLTPVMYMTAQNISGANDNLQMGLLIEWTPFKWLKWSWDVFVDDYSVDDFVKLHIDAKYRLGIKTGFAVSPNKASCSYLAADYTVQTPYLYAHWDYDNSAAKVTTFDYSTINYQNYTNAGMSMGSALPPNSDKVSFTATFNPAKWLSIDVMSNFTRHANICQSYEDEDAWYMLTNFDLKSDGSIYTSQIKNPDGSHIDAAWEHLNFMVQGDVMKVFQGGIDAKIKLSRHPGRGWTINLGYTLELVHNAGVDRLMFPPNPDLKIKVEDESLNKWQRQYLIHEEVRAARRAWERALHNDRNQYFRCSLKFAF